MKSGNALLDADLTTIVGWLRSGFDWWVEELRGLLPASLRRGDQRLDACVTYAGPGAWSQSGKDSSCPLLIDPALCLVRTMELPRLRQADLMRLIQLDADRILPIPASQLVLAARQEAGNPALTQIAGLPIATAQAAMDELRQQGFTIRRVGMADPDRPRTLALDFTDALTEAGLIDGSAGLAPRWWMLVGFLFLLNVGLLIWRDAQSVQRLDELVEAQAPAVSAARAIAARISRGQNQATLLARMREERDAMEVLAEVTRVLPERAWVQRYEWHGEEIRLSGYKRAGVDVVGALRKSPRFKDIRSSAAESVAELPTGQPFDLTAHVVVAQP